MKTTNDFDQTTATGLPIKTSVKAGFPPGPSITNHGETMSAGLRVKTALQAGIIAVL